ncbi:collagen binding domain-containing protein [Paenibacillus illinoisensis]|uniref:collagen binding domain-containing protein n=1 Tax=Paenibacillus illinoisensis TaxID=59845 RepID=UPI00203E2FB3|nr:collagen binding domain-containing protein [Paenibacillus illinoisensis]MCM3204175.1 Ig-like domain-containing protein [Paenibacillus illinoisensis]
MKRKLTMIMIALLLIIHTFFGVTVPQVEAAVESVESGQMPDVERAVSTDESSSETSEASDGAEGDISLPSPVTETKQQEGEQPKTGQEEGSQQEPQSGEEQKEESQAEVLTEQPDDPEKEAATPAVSEEKKITDAEEEPSAPKGNILTRVSLLDAVGTVIDSSSNPNQRIKADETLQLRYDWALPNNTYRAGDTFTFRLPEQFVIYTDIDEPLALEGGEEEVGRFTVDRQGNVVLTFNDYVENHSNVTGTLQIQTELSTDTVKGSTEITMVTPITSGEQTVVIRIAPPAAPALEKKGQVEPTNSKLITWTLDMNKGLDTFGGAVITDPMPAGLQLQNESIRVYELLVNGDGSTTTGQPVDAGRYTVEVLEENKGFQIRFNDDMINSAYRIEYATQMTDQSSQYTNTAVLTGEDMEETSASATVKVQRGALLTKSVAKYDPVSQTISWTIGYNMGNLHIPQASAKVSDRFNLSQELIPESLKVYKGTGNEAVDGAAYSVKRVQDENQKNGFDLQFNSELDSSYTIKYQTKASSRVYENEKILNQITTDGGSAQAEQVLRSGVMKKEVAEANFRDKTVTWKVTLNSDKYPMEQVVLRDSFPNGGLEWLPDSVKMVSLDGKSKLQSPQDFTVAAGTDGNRSGFVLRMNPSKTLNTTYVITYKTAYNSDWKINKTKPEFWNKANLEWIQNNESRTAEADARFWPDNLTKDNGAKRGSYNASTKEITWDILMNYNQKSWSQAEVRDVLQQGQTLIPESVKVYEMTLSGTWNGAGKGTEISPNRYTITQPSADNGNELRIHFAEPVNSPYWITFRTSLEGQLLTSEVKNKALVFSNGTKVAEWAATLTIPHGGVYVTKSGAQNGNKIDWKLNINEGQSTVSNARIIDEPSNNQILMSDSFHLYSTKVTAGGEISRDNELVRDRDYTLKLKKDEAGSQSFELTFISGISSAYVLEYQTFISAADKSKVTNKVRMDGERLTTEKRETEQAITVRTSSGSGTGNGVTGSLVVTKVDEDNPERKLEGATFALYDKAEKRAPMIETTDAEGKVVFSKLLYDDYVLEELIAPEGYDIGDARMDVRIDSSIRRTDYVKQMIVSNKKKEEPPVEPDPQPPVEPGTPVEPDPQPPVEPGTPVEPDPQPPVEPGTPVEPDPQPPIEPGTPVEPNPQSPVEPGTPVDPIPQTPTGFGTPGIPVPVNPIPVTIEDEDIPLGGIDPEPLPSGEETPGSEEPGIPEIPERPTQQPPVVIEDDPIPQGIPTVGIQPHQPDGGQPAMLPQTGENSKLPLYVGGTILLLLGSCLLFRRKA